MIAHLAIGLHWSPGELLDLTWPQLEAWLETLERTTEKSSHHP